MVLSLLLPSLGHATYFNLNMTLSDGNTPPATYPVLMGSGTRNPRFEQPLRDDRAQVEENTKINRKRLFSDVGRILGSSSSSSSDGRYTLESIQARVRADASLNRPRVEMPEFYHTRIEKSLDTDSRKAVTTFREVLRNESSSPFELNESIWELQSEAFQLNLSGSRDKQEQSQYLRDQIRSYVDERGIVSRAYPEIIVPRGSLHTLENSHEGLMIRKILNDAIASEAIILNTCSAGSGASLECEAFQAWSEDLNSAFFIADRLLYERQIAEFYSLSRALRASTEFIKGFAKGVLDGSINAVVALPQMVLHLPELSEAIYEALSDMPGTYEKIKEVAQAQYERILQADARELGEIAGELIAAAGSTFMAPGVFLRAARASGPLVKSLGKMGVRAALERGTEVALEEGLIQAKYVVPFKSLSKELPEVAKEVVQAKGSIGAAAEKIGESVASLGIKTKESIQGFVDTFKKIAGNENGQIDIWVGKLTGGKGLKGKQFEEYLLKNLGSEPGREIISLTSGKREFDGFLGKLWYEAKGIDWSALSDPQKLGKFKSDMGRGLRIAQENGASYHIFSSTPIPENIKKWLTETGITFLEILE